MGVRARRSGVPAGGSGEAGLVPDGGHRLVHQRVGLDEDQHVVGERGGGLEGRGGAIARTGPRPARETKIYPPRLVIPRLSPKQPAVD